MGQDNQGGIGQEQLIQKSIEKKAQLSQVQLRVEEESTQYQSRLKQNLFQRPLAAQKMDEEGVYKNRLTLIPHVENEEKKRLEKELNDGYKKAGKKKSEREEWEKDMKRRIFLADHPEAEEKRRMSQRKFVTEYINSREKTSSALKKLEADNTQKVSDYRALAVATVSENGIDFLKIADRTKGGTSEQLQSINKLALFLKSLTSITAEDLAAQYGGLQKQFSSFAFSKEGIVGEQFERGADGMTEAGFTLMLSSCVSELSRLVNSESPDLLEDEELNKLHALSHQTEMINTAMLVSDDYHSRLKEIRLVREEAAISSELDVLQEKEEILDKRMKFIATGNTAVDQEAVGNWRLSDYSEEILGILGDRIFSLSDEEFSKTITEYNDRIAINENAIAQAVSQLSTKPDYSFMREDEFREQAVKLLTDSFAGRMLSEKLAEEKYDKSEIDGQITRRVEVKADFVEDASSALFGEGGQLLELVNGLKSIFGTEGQTDFSEEEYYALLRNRKLIRSFQKADGNERKTLQSRYGKNFKGNKYLVKQWIESNASGASEAYYKAFIERYGEHLFTTSMSFIMELLDDFHAKLYTIDQNLASLVKTELGHTVSQIDELAGFQTDTYTNLTRLKGDALLGKSVFEGSFDKLTEKCSAAVISLARKGYFENLGLQKGCSEADINNLVPADFAELCEKLETNMVINFRQWSLYPSEDLLEDMMSMDEQSFEKSLRRRVSRDSDAELMEEAGFASELLDEDIRTERIVYSFDKQTASKASRFRTEKKKETRAGRRSQRMSDARSIKAALIEKRGQAGIEEWLGLLDMVTLQTTKGKKAAPKVKEKLNELVKSLKLDISEADLEGILYEIPLCDQEQYVATVHEKLIQQAEHADYDNGLKADAGLVAEREKEFWKKVLELFPQGVKLPAEVRDVYERTKFHFSMQTGNVEKDKKTWSAKLSDVAAYLENVKKEPEQREQNRKAQHLWTKRIIRFDRVQREQGDLFNKIRPYLMENKELLTAFSAYSDKEFEEVYTKLSNTVFPAVRILNERYGYVDEIFYQVLSACKASVFNPDETKSHEEWEQLFKDTYDNIFSSRFGEHAAIRINSLVRGENNCRALRRYSDLILATADFTMFSDEKKFNSAVAEYTKRIEKNEKQYSLFLKSHVGELTEQQRKVREAAITKTFFMMVRENFLQETIDESVLLSNWKKAVNAEEGTIMSTIRAEIRMNSRRKKLRDVAAGKEKGKKAAEEREKSRAVSQQLFAGNVSPSVAAALEKQGKNGKDMIPEEKTIRKANSTIDELYSKEPEYKKDFMKQLYLVSEKYRTFLSQFRMVKKIQEDKADDNFKTRIDAIELVLDDAINKMAGPQLAEDNRRVLLCRMMGLCIANFDNVEKMTTEEVVRFSLKQSEDFFEKFALEVTLDGMLAKVSELPALREEFDKTRIQLSYELYSKDAATYREHVKEAVEYFTRAEQVASVLQDVAQDNQGLSAGLFDYFYHVISDTGEINTEKIRTEAQQMLEDEVVKQYIVDSKSLLGSADRTSLSDSEKKAATVMNRETFAAKMTQLVDDDQKTKLRSFSGDDMRMFALLISQPELLGDSVNTIGMDLVHGAQKTKTKERQIRKVIAGYRQNGITEYEPDYEKALYSVTGTRNAAKLGNREAVKKAIGFIEVVKMAQLDDQLSLEADPMISVKAMHKGSVEIKTPSGPADLVAVLKAKAAEEKADKTVKIIEKPGLEKLEKRLGMIEGDSYRQALFVLILQERSLVDETAVSRYQRSQGAKTSHVDEDGREELKSLVGPKLAEQLNIDGDMLQRAMAQAYSYQRKEGSRDPKTFEAAEARSTKLDVKLLERTLDFVQELTELEYSRQIVRTAATPIMIKKSGNEKAVEALKAAEEAGVIAKTEAFNGTAAVADVKATKPEQIGTYVEDFIKAQAKQDGQMPLLAGFISLSEEEKNLFYQALSRRDLLDISKKDIWLNRFGMKDRDYVNGAERSDLIDSYIAGEKVQIEMSAVLYGLLSTQIDDSAKLEASVNLRSADKAKHVSHRNTAIDWKLFGRALQLVHRSKNEKKLADEQSQLQRSFGNTMETGEMEGNMSMLRRNIHNSGTRFTRFLSRRVVDEGLDMVPDYMKTAVRFLLPKNWSDYLNDTKPFEEEDDESWEFDANAPLAHLVQGAEHADTVAGLLNAEEDDHIGKLTKLVGEKVAGQGLSDGFQEFLGNVGDTCSYIQNGIAIAQGSVNLVRLANADKKDEKTEAADRAEFEKKLAELPDDRAQFLQQAQERNAHAVKLAKGEAMARQVDEILNASAELLGDTADKLIMDKVGSILLTEAVHTINFIRGYVRDEKNIDSFFNVGQSLAAYKKKLTESGVDTDGVKWDEKMTLNGRLNVFCKINGYENITELSEVVGMNITESVLFSASDFYKGTVRDKLVAQMILKTLGQKDLIGDISPDAAKKLYDALMGEER